MFCKVLPEFSLLIAGGNGSIEKTLPGVHDRPPWLKGYERKTLPLE